MTDHTRRRFVRIAAATAAVGLAGCSEASDGGGETDDGMTETMSSVETFEVTVTNVSGQGTITASDGEDLAVPLSPTAYAVHSPDVSAFSAGEAASNGLESLAEDGDPSTLGESLSMVDGVEMVGAVATPDGAGEAGPLGPGASYTVGHK